MTLYSFFGEVPGLNVESELRLAILWRRLWLERGVQAIVLNEWHAMKHPLYANLVAAVSKLPTTNPPIYELLCWMRWLALGVVGGGFMSDLDLMPGIGAADKLSLYLCPLSPVVIYQGSCPALAYATVQGVDLLAAEFIAYARRHHGSPGQFSDMYAIEDTTAPWLSKVSIVKLYSEPGWETAPFIHYANAVSAKERKPRHELIPLTLPAVPTPSTVSLLTL